MKNVVKTIGIFTITACIAYTGYSVYTIIKKHIESNDKKEGDSKECHISTLPSKIKEKIKDKNAYSSFTEQKEI